MFYQIQPPAVSAFFHLAAVIPPFVEQAFRAGQQPGRRKVQQQRQRRQCPRGHHLGLRDSGMGVLDTPRDHPRGQTEPADHGLQEPCLLPVALDQVDAAAPFDQQESHNQTGEPPARTKIDPALRGRLDAGQLGTVENMAAPYIRLGRCGDEVNAAVPFTELVLEFPQAIACFT